MPPRPAARTGWSRIRTRRRSWSRLPPAAADNLLDGITKPSAPGSVLAFDHNEDSPLLRAARAVISPDLVGMWHGGPTDELGAWLSAHGWQPTVDDLSAVATRFGRPVPPAFDPARPDAGRGWLVTALRT